MTTDDIIRMAKEAGFDKNSLGTTFTHGKLDENILRFAALVAAAEREECAKVCDEFADDAVKEQDFHAIATAEDCAAYIRARGQE
jgi:hypothetical protein